MWMWQAIYLGDMATVAGSQWRQKGQRGLPCGAVIQPVHPAAKTNETSVA